MERTRPARGRRCGRRRTDASPIGPTPEEKNRLPRGNEGATMKNYQRREIYVSPKSLALYVGGGLLVFLLIVGGSQVTEIIQPGYRGVAVTLGKVSPEFKGEGLVVKAPF